MVIHCLSTSPTLPTKPAVLTYNISSHHHSLSCQCQTPVLFPEPGKLPASLYYVDWAKNVKYQSISIRAVMVLNMLEKVTKEKSKKTYNAKLMSFH